MEIGMETIVYGIFCILAGYLTGCINPAYFIARMRGFDIRAKGSGNAGASNAVITMGKGIGIFTALFDIGKAIFITQFMRGLLDTFAMAFILTAVSCILGHIFPFYMQFRGGKGLAALGGVVLSYDWKIFLIFLCVELVLVLLSDYLCMVPVTASVAFTFVYGWQSRSLLGTCALLLATGAILYRHVENFRRIRNGTEAHFSYLWKGEKELERISSDQSK